MARNPRPQTQTYVTPNIRPVDTFVQPAPIDNTKLKELDAFISNLVPRVNRYAQIQQGRQDKKDVIAAQKAFAKVSDKLLSFDEQVRKGEIPPDQSPMFRFAFNQSQGAQIGLNFIQKANEDYMRSNLPSATNSNGFNAWFDKYKADYVKDNEALLNLLGSFDAFEGYARQAQQNLLTSHLASVKKNFTTSASESAILQAERAIEAGQTLIKNNKKLMELDDPEVIEKMGVGLARTIAKEITNANDNIVKSSSNYIKFPKQNKKVIDAIVGKYVQIADLSGDDDDREYILQMETILRNVKTRDGQSLFDTTYGEQKYFEALNLINKNAYEKAKIGQELLDTNRDNTEQKLINVLYKTLTADGIESDKLARTYNPATLLENIEFENPELMQELTEYGIGDWKGIILTEFNTWRNNAEDPMTDSEKSTMHNTILNSLYSNDPKANYDKQYQVALKKIKEGKLRGNFALEILNKIETRKNSYLVTERNDGKLLAKSRSNALADPVYKSIFRYFEEDTTGALAKVAKIMGTNQNEVWGALQDFKAEFADLYHEVKNGKRTYFELEQSEQIQKVRELFENTVAPATVLNQITVTEDGNSIESESGENYTPINRSSVNVNN